jgi:hypothetical protein
VAISPLEPPQSAKAWDHGKLLKCVRSYRILKYLLQEIENQRSNSTMMIDHRYNYPLGRIKYIILTCSIFNTSIRRENYIRIQSCSKKAIVNIGNMAKVIK